ncbi:MAG: hypothetical protein Q8L48_19940 [Archangium sp.]|nr:hypothetical protein [Archangium sp.]
MRRPWVKPAVRSSVPAPPSVLLACSAGRPVDCFPLDGYHHCVQNACGCDSRPPHC